MIEPILDNLLLEPLDVEEVNKSGILRPETAKEKPAIGKILAVGPDVKSSPKARGFTKAIYKKWQATEIKVDGKTYILVAEKDVLGVIK